MPKPLFSFAPVLHQTRLIPRVLLMAALLLNTMALNGAPAYAEEVVTAGVLRNFPPLFFLDAEGKPTGLGVNLLDALGKRAGFKVRYKIYQRGKPLIDDLESGKLDLVSTIGITPAREKLFDFSLPLETYPISLFVRQGTHDVNGLEDLAGKRISVVKVNAAVRLLEKRQEITLISYLTVEGALFALLSGNVEAMAFPRPILWKVARQGRVAEQIKEVGPPLHELRRAIAVTKGRQDLLQRLNAVIPEFISTEAYQKIYAKWYGEPEPYWTVFRVSMAAGGTVLVSALFMFALHWFSLMRVNSRLRNEVTERIRAEQAVVEARDQLEVKVQHRTQELNDTNQQLRGEAAERTRAEDQLRKAHDTLLRNERLAALGQLTASVSHELRNPLSVIQNSMHLISLKLDGQPIDLDRPMERIDRSVKRCTAIVEDMLEYARIQEPEPHVFQFDPWWDTILQEYSLPPQIHLALNLDAENIMVSLDSEGMRRAVMNLLDNACQAMELDMANGNENSRLSVSTSVDHDRLILSITDSGRGLSEDASQHLFEPLFSTKPFGVGLGLAIVRKILEASGRSIGLINRKDAAGARATVTLPVFQG
ncbi:MAG: transporter substrate-binding domain-containing protein [SAR324 cluster bacterium]|nr:transporter substrate-binding domain-containing protein [SAR324 cluster bacterium]